MIQVDMTIDAKGLSCPMPIVKAKKAIHKLQPGQVLEVQATDKGSKADMKSNRQRIESGYESMGRKHWTSLSRYN